MPWKNLSDEQERRAFVVAAQHAAKCFAALCRLSGVSRKTGYKWLQRYRADPKYGLESRSRRPRQTRAWGAHWRRRLVQWRRRLPTWGGRKLWQAWRLHWPRQHLPAARTLERWVGQAQLSGPRRQRRRRGPVTAPAGRRLGLAPNDVWTVDFKGRFRHDGEWLEPLTVFDLASRCGLAARQLAAKDYAQTRKVLFALFRRHGRPRAIQVDNGPPFGGEGAWGLSRLSAEWVRLGIQVQFGRPRRPEDNAAHERWHRTLEDDLRRLPELQGRPAQAKLQRFLQIYNGERPHAHLHGQCPAQCYRASPTGFAGRWPTHVYPARWGRLTPNRKGYAWWAGRQRLFGRPFAGQPLGLKPVGAGRWEVYLCDLLLGHLVASDRAGLRPVQLNPLLPVTVPACTRLHSKGRKGRAAPSPGPSRS